MNNTNYIGSVAKVLELPIQNILQKNVLMTEFRVQLPQARNSNIVNLVFWGNLANDIRKYYKPNDYIIIEGYISTRNKIYNDLTPSNIKKVEITVLKVYPISLN